MKDSFKCTVVTNMSVRDRVVTHVFIARWGDCNVCHCQEKFTLLCYLKAISISTRPQNKLFKHANSHVSCSRKFHMTYYISHLFIHLQSWKLFPWEIYLV